MKRKQEPELPYYIVDVLEKDVQDGKKCKSCRKFRKAYANYMCASCYAAWRRQVAKWRKRKEIIILASQKMNYKKIAYKIYGKSPFCNKCGRKEFITENSHGVATRSTRIHIHHMDKNHENNSPENLEPLCARCHKLVPGKEFDAVCAIISEASSRSRTETIKECVDTIYNLLSDEDRELHTEKYEANYEARIAISSLPSLTIKE